MQADVDAVLLTDGDHSLQEVLQIVPQGILLDPQAGIDLGVLDIKARDQSAAPFGIGAGGTVPAHLGTEVGADGLPAVFRQGGDHLDDLFDAFVPLVVAPLDVVVDIVGHGLHHQGMEAVFLELVRHGLDVGRIGDVEFRILRQTDYRIVDAQLLTQLPLDTGSAEEIIR